MIKMIDVNKIIPHPDNPRKELGDLTELADSIKKYGILQNLTIVPLEDLPPELEDEGYYAIIGHRRLSAAKLAGLTQVPCAISDMDHKTQVSTMLLENMQREDLTIYEQAQGFQMMMNFGESIKDISEKTGLHQSTVRTRVKLLELNQDKLKESSKRGATLMEYMELSKIKDINKRNEVLEHVGTREFRWELNNAIDAQEQEEIKQKLIERVEAFAKNIDEADPEKTETRWIARLRYAKESLEKEIDIEEGKEYLYEADSWSIVVYENTYGQAETEEERKSREQREKKRIEELEREDRIRDIKKRAISLREEFILSLTNTRLMKHLGEIILLGVESNANFSMWEDISYIKAFNLDIEKDEFELKELEEDLSKRPALSLLKIISLGKFKYDSYVNYRSEYMENENLDKLYALLEKLGYEMSEEEKQLSDGSHEIFKDAQEV